MISPDGVAATREETVAGYLAHKVGVGSFLEVGHPFRASPPVGLGGNTFSVIDSALLLTEHALIAKHSTSGSLISAIDEERLGSGGIGYGLGVKDGSVFSVGVPFPIPQGVAQPDGEGFRRLEDNAGVFSVGGDAFVQDVPFTEWAGYLNNPCIDIDQFLFYRCAGG